MPRKIALVAVAMLLGLPASPATADRMNFLSIALLKDRVDSTDEYMIFFSPGKDGATSCTFTTPSDPSGSACPLAPGGGPPGIIRSGLSFSGLTDEIGLGTGVDWTLTYDEGLSTETIATIDFGSVLESDWMNLPTITNPPNGATDVSPHTSIDWTWPTSPGLGLVEVSLVDPDNNELRETHEPPLDATSVTPLSPLTPGDWLAVVLYETALRDGLDGIVITGDEWVPEESEWLGVHSMDISSFTVIPEPTSTLLLACALVGLGVRRLLHQRDSHNIVTVLSSLVGRGERWHDVTSRRSSDVACGRCGCSSKARRRRRWLGVWG